jgi:hypothetical protein
MGKGTSTTSPAQADPRGGAVEGERRGDAVRVREAEERGIRAAAGGVGESSAAGAASCGVAGGVLVEAARCGSARALRRVHAGAAVAAHHRGVSGIDSDVHEPAAVRGRLVWGSMREGDGGGEGSGIEMERGSDEVRALDGVDGGGKTELEDEAWVPAEFAREPPVLEVTQPKGSFCQIDTRFSMALNPDGVYNIITDPNNRHVFKNIKVRVNLVLRSVAGLDLRAGTRIRIDRLWRAALAGGPLVGVGWTTHSTRSNRPDHIEA